MENFVPPILAYCCRIWPLKYPQSTYTQYLSHSLSSRNSFYVVVDVFICWWFNVLYDITLQKIFTEMWSCHHKYGILLSCILVKFKIKKPIVVQSARLLVLFMVKNGFFFFFFFRFTLSFNFWLTYVQNAISAFVCMCNSALCLFVCSGSHKFCCVQAIHKC